MSTLMYTPSKLRGFLPNTLLVRSLSLAPVTVRPSRSIALWLQDTNPAKRSATQKRDQPATTKSKRQQQHLHERVKQKDAIQFSNAQPGCNPYEAAVEQAHSGFHQPRTIVESVQGTEQSTKREGGEEQ
jgi:hypothetical protein